MPVYLLVVLLVAMPGIAAAQAAPVRAVPLSELAIYPSRSAPATVVSSNESVISAEIAARVVAFLPRVGDIVEAGATIARLDCRDYELELVRARADLEVLQARLELARRRLERARELTARQSLAVEVMDEREAESAVLEAEITGGEARIAQAGVAVSRCTVNSPFRALVRERLAPVGQYARVGDAVARLIDVVDLELAAEVEILDAAAVADNAALAFVAGGVSYPVRLRVSVAAIDTATRKQELRLTFAGPAPLSGAAGKLVWQDARPHVPGKALVERDGELGLFLAEAGRARFVAVPSAQAGRASAVSLPAGSLVVIEGQYGLTDGQALRLLDD